MPSRSNVLWRLQTFSLARYRTSRGVIFHTSGRGREIFSDLHVGVNLNEKSKHVKLVPDVFARTDTQHHCHMQKQSWNMELRIPNVNGKKKSKQAFSWDYSLTHCCFVEYDEKPYLCLQCGLSNFPSLAFPSQQHMRLSNTVLAALLCDGSRWAEKNSEKWLECWCHTASNRNISPSSFDAATLHKKGKQTCGLTSGKWYWRDWVCQWIMQEWS